MTTMTGCRPLTVSDIYVETSTKNSTDVKKNQGQALWNGNDVMPPHDQAVESICAYDKAGDPCLRCPPE